VVELGVDLVLGEVILLVDLPVLDLLDRLLFAEGRLVLDDGVRAPLVLGRGAGGELGRDGR
jgi:hypothetical protein